MAAATEVAAKDSIVAAAANFFKEVLPSKGSKGGRRNGVDTNAFWAAAAALLPADVLQNRQGRACARLLGVNYAFVKKASDIRSGLEQDTACGWKEITNKQRLDKLPNGPCVEWWHTDTASAPDNDNKRQISVECGVDADGEMCYVLHEQRYEEETDEVNFKAFKASAAWTEMQAADRATQVEFREAKAKRELKWEGSFTPSHS